jgi:signal transduction histidine kinase
VALAKAAMRKLAKEERSPVLQLTLRYVIGLSALAALAIVGQLVMQSAMTGQVNDSRAVNLAGRQRMLSQRLCALALAAPTGGPERITELHRVADEWERMQARLRHGDAWFGTHDDETRASVDLLYAEIAPNMVAMLAAARTIDGEPEPAAIQTLLREQEPFLAGMDKIVFAYDEAAQARVHTVRRSELTLFGCTLVVLLLEGLFVFRPGALNIRKHLAERKKMEGALIDNSDREQRRLGQDLHDGLCQDLVGMAFLLKAMEREASPEVAVRISEVERLIDEGLGQARGLARGLYPLDVEVNGLVSGLRELARRTKATFGVECVFSTTAPPGNEPETPVAQHGYRIAQEAVANALKHAKAKRIEISLTTSSSATTIIVEDDGVGLPEVMPATPGMGLHMMSYRARMMGASLRVQGASAGGTRVVCEIPIAGGERPIGKDSA